MLDFVNSQEDILAAFQPFYQGTVLKQEVNVDLIYQTQKELRGYGIYSDTDIEAFAKEYFKPGKQDIKAVGRMSSTLKPVEDRYNQKTVDERYQFRRQARSLVKWYSYISQVVRMFDKELHKEFVFCSYLLKLLPADPVDMVDLEGKLPCRWQGCAPGDTPGPRRGFMTEKNTAPANIRRRWNKDESKKNLPDIMVSREILFHEQLNYLPECDMIREIIMGLGGAQ